MHGSVVNVGRDRLFAIHRIPVRLLLVGDEVLAES
jgi:hypothetical protein